MAPIIKRYQLVEFKKSIDECRIIKYTPAVTRVEE